MAGGLKLDETANDLGLCMAIATGLRDICLPPDMIFIGEVGLGGELRTVSQLEKRLSEAAKLGFTQAICPRQSLKGVKIPENFQAIGVKDIKEALSYLK